MFGYAIWKVRGHSMAPALLDGSFVLLRTRVNVTKLTNGCRVIIKHPQFGDMVKTVAYVDSKGVIWCRGENQQSISMAQIGAIKKEQIIGRVIASFAPPVKTPAINGR